MPIPHGPLSHFPGGLPDLTGIDHGGFADWRSSREDLTITVVAEDTVYAGALWLHAVDDGQEMVAVSVEIGGDIYLARIDPLSLDGTTLGSTAWHALGVPKILSDEGYEFFCPDGGRDQLYDDLSDHWHLFAHGYHWIAVSLKNVKLAGDSDIQLPNSGVLLIKFSISAGGAPTLVGHEMIKWPKDSNDYYDPTDSKTLINPTNDLFAVDIYDFPSDNGSPTDGIAVGVLHAAKPGWTTAAQSSGTTIIRADSDCQPIDEILFTSTSDSFSANPQHVNGASAVHTSNSRDSDIYVIAPGTMSPMPPMSPGAKDGTLKTLTASRSWTITDASTLAEPASADHYFYSQAMAAQLDDEHWAVVYRRVSYNTVLNDYGDIVLTILHGDPDTGVVLERRTLANDASRPHLLFFKSHLVICWDDMSGATMHVEKVTGLALSSAIIDMSRGGPASWTRSDDLRGTPLDEVRLDPDRFRMGL